ncbi:hypothetical protein [Winslowiella toletana]|uniref:hypothetical protein n=1 Tax=Winslowiella toletana TaxID=92490 RepID=UPI0028BDB62A|nr:hypothetical protein [Winslowiella toletana]WNN42663.1 hypothetical protein RIN69_13135 [Winslowiella toletana]
MSTFLIIAFPLLAVGLALVALFYRKRDKNFLIPGFVLIAAGLVNAVIGMGVS